MPLDRTEPKVLAWRLPQVNGICLAWSPRGGRIAYTTRECGQKPGIYAVTADGSDFPSDLSAPGKDRELSSEEPPRWSADGRTILCPAKEGHWQVAADESSQRRVRPDMGTDVLRWVQRPCASTSWRPDDDTYLYVVRNSVTKHEGLARVDTERARGPC